jgi:putative heme transporter
MTEQHEEPEPAPSVAPSEDPPTTDARGPHAPATGAGVDGAPAPVHVDFGRPLVRLGRAAWAMLGIAGLVALALLVASRLTVVVVPLLLALFPAALLAPAVGLLHRGRLPRPLATALVVVAATAMVGGVFSFVVPAFLAQLPELTASLSEAGTRLDNGLLHQLPGVPPSATVGGLIQTAATTFIGGVSAALYAALTLVLGLGLVLVVLVCYLSGGPRMVDTGLALLPARHRPATRELADRLWTTLGTYIRALSLVALFDASAVAVGLMLLGVPLAVLVFFGAFIPYIGAFVSGLAAVLVAFATGGPGTALAVLVLIVVVQQVDGNLVQPLVMGRATLLSAFTVIVVVTAGAALLGVLGAFLAVPAAACLAQTLAFVRERRSAPDGPGQ